MGFNSAFKGLIKDCGVLS